MTMQHNAQDPLRKSGPQLARDLFEKCAHAADNHSAETVIDAAGNLMINAIRQTFPSRSQAEREFNELAGKFKQMLLDHYDSVTGKRKNIFPFTQFINVQCHVDKDKNN